ncbi:MAG: trehalase family glycosidase [Planctomycetota bacterium]
MGSSPPSGWNTWDWKSYTRLVLLREGVEQIAIGAAVLDDLSGELRHDFHWADMLEVGPHARRGGPASVMISGGMESPFRWQWAAKGERLFVRMVPGRSTWRRAVLFVARPGDGRFAWKGGTLRCGEFEGRAWGAAQGVHVLVGSEDPHWVGEPGETLRVCLGPGVPGSVTAAEVDGVIDAALQAYATSGLHGEGRLAELPEAMCRAVHWNTVLHPRLARPVVVATREWCRSWQGVLLFGWDTLLAAALAAAEDPDLAYDTLECALDAVDSLGFVPNWVFASGGVTTDRSHPPVGAIAALRVWRTARDPERMRAILEKLVRWHDWWPSARDRGDGLLSWGSNATPLWRLPQIRQRSQCAQICACWESGLDNSPLYDAVPFAPDRATLVDADVGLNALWAADAERLAVLACELGEARLAQRLAQEHRTMATRLDEQFFDAGRGFHANLGGTPHSFCRRVAPTSLWPLLSGATTSERASGAVRCLLEDASRLGGDFGLPSITRDDPAFRDNDYWRGRVWAPLNFITYEALRRMRFSEAAARMAELSLRHFAKGWFEERGIFENYSATTGRGGDVPNSDRLYTWGGLLALTAVCDLIDTEIDGTLRVGTPDARPVAVRGLRLLDASWDVESDSSGLRVRRDGENYLRTEKPARVIVREGSASVVEGEAGRVIFRG